MVRVAAFVWRRSLSLIKSCSLAPPLFARENKLNSPYLSLSVPPNNGQQHRHQRGGGARARPAATRRPCAAPLAVAAQPRRVQAPPGRGHRALRALEQHDAGRRPPGQDAREPADVGRQRAGDRMLQRLDRARAPRARARRLRPGQLQRRLQQGPPDVGRQDGRRRRRRV